MKRDNPEQRLHFAVAQFLEAALPWNVFWFHPANGGKRNLLEAVKFKRMGVKAGVPDLCFIEAGEVFFIELKAKGALSKAQLEVIGQIGNAGSVVYVAHSVEEVEDILRRRYIRLRATTGKHLNEVNS